MKAAKALFVAAPLLLLLSGCMTKIIVPDHVTQANGQPEYHGELPAHLLTQNDCDAVRVDERHWCTAVMSTPEQVAAFPSQQLAWTEAHTEEVPMWGCAYADWITTGIAVIFYGAVETNPLGVAGAIAYDVVTNKIADAHAAKGDGSIAKTSAAVHCGLSVWNAAQIARVAL